MCNIRKGDKVTLTFDVLNDPNFHDFFDVKHPRMSGILTVHKKDVTSHTPAPRPIEVGCFVQSANHSEYHFEGDAKVIALSNDGYAWIKGNICGYLTRHISILHRID